MGCLPTNGAGVLLFTHVQPGRSVMRYVHIEAGHAAENLFLQAVSPGLNSVVVGTFRDDAVRNLPGLPEDHAPLILMPVGR